MASASLQIFECRVAGIEKATDDIAILRLEPEAGKRLRFEAGQYASLKFRDRPPRDYSMANRPDERILEFHIRDTQTGGTSGYVAAALEPGERVKLAGPYGAMRLKPDHDGPILCIAGGSGLAPMKSIAETALGAGMTQPIHLYFGARAARDVYLADRFASVMRRHPNFRFVAAIASEAAPGCRRGTVTDALAEDFPDLHGFLTYLAGPPALVEAARALLERRGADPENILADPFFTDAEKEKLGLPITDSPLAD